MSVWRVIREASWMRSAADAPIARTHKRVYTLEHSETSRRRQLEIRSTNPEGLTDAAFRPALRKVLDLAEPPASILLPRR